MGFEKRKEQKLKINDEIFLSIYLITIIYRMQKERERMIDRIGKLC